MNSATSVLPWFWSEVLPPPVMLPLAIPRIFVIDDDPVFCRNLHRVGTILGVQVHTFHPDTDFDSLPEDGAYDAAIIDYDLGMLRGTQISVLYRATPVLLISSKQRNGAAFADWSTSVCAFLPKSEGATEILRAAARLGSAT